MPVDKGLVAHLMGMLEPLGGVTGKAMFGGYGIWHDGQMFALIASDSTFYLKTDDSNRARFEAAGSEAFQPPMPRGRRQMTMPYHVVPAEVVDDADTLREWARASIAVAHSTPPRRRRG
ncbi:MAG: TfoX/Sxy family protein [Dehalococcoidia bacterium]